MCSSNKRYSICCPGCGCLLEKTSKADTEIRCNKCKVELLIVVEEDSIQIRILNRNK